MRASSTVRQCICSPNPDRGLRWGACVGPSLARDVVPTSSEQWISPKSLAGRVAVGKSHISTHRRLRRATAQVKFRNSSLTENRDSGQIFIFNATRPFQTRWARLAMQKALCYSLAIAPQNGGPDARKKRAAPTDRVARRRGKYPLLPARRRRYFPNVGCNSYLGASRGKLNLSQRIRIFPK